MKFLLQAIVLLILVSCSTPRLSVSESLKTSNDAYSVKGRQGILINQKLSFGEFKTTKVKRSWTRGNSSQFGVGTLSAQNEWVNLISLEYINRKQTINFSLTDGERQSEVFCVTKFNAEDLHVGKNPNSILNIALELAGIGSSSNNFYVQVFDGTDGMPWQLLLDNQEAQSKPKKYTGVFAKSKTDYYTIVPVTRLETNGKSGNMLFGSAGFEIKNPKGEAVAAVSLIDKGMIFLGKTTKEERFLMANLSAALLLQENIGG